MIESEASMTSVNITSILEIMDIHTQERTILHRFEGVIEAPNWTQNGEHLVYNRQGRLYTYQLATGNIQQIDTGFATNCNNDHVLSPDNKQIAISHHTQNDHLSRIYVVPFTGGEPRLVTTKAPSYLHGWSPDGQQFAYCAERNGQYDIYTIGVDGGEETQLTDLPSLDDGPEYAPSGEHIWFNSTRTGLMQIWRMNTDGTNPVQMAKEDANCWFPHVSPNGEWVVYLTYGKDDVAPDDHPANKHVELRLMPATGGKATTIAKLFGGQGTLNVNSWSPDNRTFAFVSYELHEGV
jgi:TolB protein